MEPARDERGDLKRGEDRDSIAEPQWSPLAMSGATVTQRYCPGVTLGPQWSPLAMSGATRLTGHAGDRHGAAAMEPARDERGDRDGAPGAPAAQLVPQWSPLAMSGATRPNLLFVGAQPSPQW